jgi:hypothetical protein
MLRIALLVLIATASRASAQSAEDIKHDMSSVDQRMLVPYQRQHDARDVLAKVHDSISHGEYKKLRAMHDKFIATHRAIEKALAADDLTKANKLLAELTTDGEAMRDQLTVYARSSADKIEKIQIGLGVGVFGIAGLMFWLVKRRKK